jgi:hypothetical protein
MGISRLSRQIGHLALWFITGMLAWAGQVLTDRVSHISIRYTAPSAKSHYAPSGCRRLRFIALTGRLGRSVILECAQLDQVEVEGEHLGTGIPNETVHAIANNGTASGLRIRTGSGVSRTPPGGERPLAQEQDNQ